ncbi:MAG: DMT family transporter [Candidatus Methanomethylicaceae archaeon]
MTLISTLALVPFLPLSTWIFIISPLSISAVFYTSIVYTIFGFCLFYRALKELTVANDGIILLFEIIVAIIVANVFLGEMIPQIGLIGVALIVAGILLV